MTQKRSEFLLHTLLLQQLCATLSTMQPCQSDSAGAAEPLRKELWSNSTWMHQVKQGSCWCLHEQQCVFHMGLLMVASWQHYLAALESHATCIIALNPFAIREKGEEADYFVMVVPRKKTWSSMPTAFLPLDVRHSYSLQARDANSRRNDKTDRVYIVTKEQNNSDTIAKQFEFSPKPLGSVCFEQFVFQSRGLHGKPHDGMLL